MRGWIQVLQGVPVKAPSLELTFLFHFWVSMGQLVRYIVSENLIFTTNVPAG